MHGSSMTLMLANTVGRMVKAKQRRNLQMTGVREWDPRWMS